MCRKHELQSLQRGGNLEVKSTWMFFTFFLLNRTTWQCWLLNNVYQNVYEGFGGCFRWICDLEWYYLTKFSPERSVLSRFPTIFSTWHNENAMKGTLSFWGTPEFLSQELAAKLDACQLHLEWLHGYTIPHQSASWSLKSSKIWSRKTSTSCGLHLVNEVMNVVYMWVASDFLKTKQRPKCVPYHENIKRSVHESKLRLWKIPDSQLVIILSSLPFKIIRQFKL